MTEQMDNLPMEDGKEQTQLISTENTKNDTEIDSTSISYIEKEYNILSFNELIDEVKKILNSGNILRHKNSVKKIKEAFNTAFLKEKNNIKEEFLSSGGLENDFSYTPTYEKEFVLLINQYFTNYKKEQVQLESKLKENLQIRLSIIDDLKDLYLKPTVDHHHTFKKFRDLKERWSTVGHVPKNEMDNIYKTYHHHLENYYEYLDLNRGLQELEYKNNLEQKNALIQKAKELTEETNLQKAFNELQFLHKVWREVGPVEANIREEKWQEFKALTKLIHDKKQEYNEILDQEQEKNHQKKIALINELKSYIEEKPDNHQQWHDKIVQVEAYKDKFKNIGRVPKEVHQKLWDEFKAVCREFNHDKNAFYRDLKNTQTDNLHKKQALINEAKEINNSEDWEPTFKKLVQIQNEWKKVGHVPRKQSDALWKEFKTVCNVFFDRYHSFKNNKNESNNKIYENQQNFIEELKSIQPESTIEKLSEQIETLIKKWEAIGNPEKNSIAIAQKYDNAFKSFLSRSIFDENTLQEFQLNILINQLDQSKDLYKIDHEIKEARKNINEYEHEILNLENNMAFFSNASDDNPIFKNVQQNIAKAKEQLNYWKNRYSRLIRIQI